MKRIFCILGFPLLLWGCERGEGEARGERGTMTLPAFSVRVELSEAAARELGETGETVLVAAHFDGPGEPIPGEHVGPWRDVYLGRAEREMEGAGVVHFSDVEVAVEDHERLETENFYVTLNVMSGRRAHDLNLLRCSVPVARIDDLKDRITTVACRLIGEESGQDTEPGE